MAALSVGRLGNPMAALRSDCPRQRVRGRAVEFHLARRGSVEAQPTQLHGQVAGWVGDDQASQGPCGCG